MAYNYGFVATATILSGAANTVVTANTTGTTQSGVRLFDACLLTTAAIVNLYSQNLTSGATNFVLRIDNNQKFWNSDAGVRFEGNLISSCNAITNNLATITYIKEF